MTSHCPICESRRSPHRAGEQLQPFRSALAALRLPGEHAHPSCLRTLVNTRMRRAIQGGHKMPAQDAAISTKLNALEKLNEQASGQPDRR